MGPLEGKAAIITGAATGIGRATAILFARAGARLTLADLRKDELEKAVAAVRAAGGDASAVVADLARPDDCEKVVTGALAVAGRLDVVFNNAGVGTMVVGGTVETIELDKWDLALDVNVRAMYLVSRAALPALRRAGGGSIINTSSVSAFRGSTGRPSHAYAASKGAVLALTRPSRAVPCSSRPTTPRGSAAPRSWSTAERSPPRAEGAQPTNTPPDGCRSSPVKYDASSEARNSAVAAISSGLP